jgi:inhibitor of KinA sporulation pathway (predicted exonuclease)
LASTDTVAILDLEYTSWEGARARNWSGPGEYREIVEIGLLVCHGPVLAEVSALSVLVRPRLNPQLSRYFCDLTGITQEAIDAAGDFAAAEKTVLVLLNRELPDAREARIWSFGEDGEIFAEN